MGTRPVAWAVPRILLALLVAFAAAASPRAAAAHAVVRATDPADGAVLETAPASVSIRFSEPVAPISVRVIGRDGDVADPLAATSADGVVTLPLPPTVPDGGYLLSWRVTSLDGHPVAGAISFAIGAAAATAGPAIAVSDDPWPAATVRFLHYLSLLSAAGLALFLALSPLVVARGLANALRVATATAALTAALGVGVEGVELLGTPLGTLGLARAWAVGGASSIGPSALVTVIGLVVLLLGLEGRRASGARLLLLLGAVVAVAGLALTGHAGTTAPRWLTGPALALHALAASFWAGSLLPLLAIVVGRPRAEAAAALSRFSFRATLALLVLVGCGAVLVAVQVPGLEGLASTEYGIRLLAKLALVAAMLGLAALNRWRLTPRLAAGDPSARRLLVRSIAAETALAVGVVGLTVALGLTPPPRTIAATAVAERCGPEAGTRLALSGDGIAAGLTVLPACTGTNGFYVTVTDAQGRPAAPIEATLRLTLPQAGVEPVTVALDPVGEGRFRATSGALALPGAWQARLELLIDDFHKTTLIGELSVSPAQP